MIAGKYIQFVVLCVAGLLAIFIGSNIVTLPPAGLGIIGAAILVVGWMLLAGENWWVPTLPFCSILGTFYVGIKVYPSELGVALAVIGLVPLVLAQDRDAFQYQRKSLPLPFYLTALYIVIRLLIDVLPAAGYRGSLFRVMFGYSWGFLFILLFHHYGSFKAARTTIICIFVFTMLKTFAAIAGYFLNIPIYIPGINYVLSFSSGDSLTQMRIVAVTLMMSTIIIYNAAKTSLSRMILFPIILFSAVMVLLGAGRFQTLVMLSLPIVFFAWSRNWLLLICFSIMGSGVIAFINVAPDSLQALPPSAGRALSGLVFTTDSAGAQFGTEQSDNWHSSLRTVGFQRWTSSPINFLFGDGISPSPDLFETLSFRRDNVETLNNAANIGAYEDGLWGTLAILGTVGFGLYLWLFITLWRSTIPYFLRRPRATFWDGFMFWGVYSSVLWYMVCYFQGTSPLGELVILMLAWDLVHDGKMDEDPVSPAPTVPISSSMAIPGTFPVRARG